MGFLDRSRTIAGTGWNRWLIPPAALAIHFSIGQAYAWSVFKIPLEDSLDISGTASALPFQIGILVLGLSAAFGGTLVEKKGPRWAMFVALVAFSSGFLIAALGVATRNYWLVVLGYGGVGGVGLGIGYIAPVSTLMKWFPDRPGMATGTAIMGFGGGALIASPWSTEMLRAFGSDTSGIAQAFLVHGLAYAVFMSLGVVLIRVPPEGWRPAGWTPRDDAGKKLVTTANVSARNAVRTPQFWLLWVVLCMNVTAGIGILEKAAPMIQDFFHGSDSPVSATAATGFVALLSLANMAGRFVWSSVSDLVGRKNVYRLYLGAGALLYLTIMLEKDSSTALFVASTMVILSFYGGGFATAPAYLKDLFGTYQVGAIHGRLLTAWSVAGVAGPLIVDSIADSAHESGRTGPGLYTFSFSLMMGLLVIGFIANELVRPVNPKFHEPEPATPVKAAAERSADPDGPERPATPEEAASSKKSAAPDAHSDPIPAERR
ncbi:OFA family MFS transporter [Streptomyces sp. SRF1]|uniref:L-lactate MFS transporter n=1 Tax=Streptomyces sp. SRF1 TaxID=1549642 RepID=UPI0025B143ED|nr:OFA family MFS transporter [Streptomyces sp. SRF1]MDN3057853.1 OFA family MFS transporter [Streptomyces sp. SRF1]